jgi:beta-lactamase class A
MDKIITRRTTADGDPVVNLLSNYFIEKPHINVISRCEASRNLVFIFNNKIEIPCLTAGRLTTPLRGLPPWGFVRNDNREIIFQMSLIYILMLFLSFPMLAISQTDTARNRIGRIVEQAEGRVGVAVINMKTRDTLTVNGRGEFPMQSVFKFPLALAILHQVDNGTFSLDQRIHIDKADLLPNTWSPLREKYPNGNIDLTIDELLTATVSQSDNNGCDILFRLVGGPEMVDRYVHALGIEQMAVVSTEQEMHKEWNLQYRNWSSPYAMGILLSKFYQDSILSKKSTEYLWRIMVNTKSGPGRIKGGLPEGSIVGHKTGSSGTNENGLAAATNDAGIVILPNNMPFAVVVFVSDSNAGEKERDKVIADIARAVWDSFSIR